MAATILGLGFRALGFMMVSWNLRNLLGRPSCPMCWPEVLLMARLSRESAIAHRPLQGHDAPNPEPEP